MKKKYKAKKSPRKHVVAFLLNDQEWNALMHYTKRFKIKNRSNLIRNTLMKHIIERFNNDQLTLF